MSIRPRVKREITYSGDVTAADYDLMLMRHGLVAGASGDLREQDDIVHDPNDPNLGANPEREWKHYFSALVSASPTIWVTFSADGRTSWSAPTQCTMGAGRASEDPSIVTKLTTAAARGEVYRDGSNKCYLYCEDNATSTVYVYESTDGITWTQMSGNPVIDLGGGVTWDADLTGSPCGRHDGSQFIIGYEGINTYESFGIAYGATANSLTKSANNPVWKAQDEDLAVDGSIVVDSLFLNEAETEIWFLAHSGVQPATTPTVWRGKTTNLSPTTWQNGDIASVGTYISTIRNDVTVDHSAGDLSRIISGTEDDDFLGIATVYSVGPSRVSRIMQRASSTFTEQQAKARPSSTMRHVYTRPGDVDTGLQLWLRAEEMNLADGDKIAWWRNLATPSIELRQDTDSNRPTFKIVSGRRLVRFAGNEWVVSTPIEGSSLLQNVSAATVMLVFSDDMATAGAPFIVSKGDSQTQARFSIDKTTAGTTSIRVGGRRLDADSFASTTYATLSAGVVKVLVAILDYTNTDLLLRINGSQVASNTSWLTTGSTSNTAPDRVTVGSNNGAASYFDGDIYEVALWHRILASDELAALEESAVRYYGAA